MGRIMKRFIRSSVMLLVAAIALPSASAAEPAQDPKTCSVCLEVVDEGAGDVVSTTCRHLYHVDCLAKWDSQKRAYCSKADQEGYHADPSCSECMGTGHKSVC